MLTSHNQNVRKCLWSLHHVLRDGWRHRASFGITIENALTRVWFGCRTAVFVSTPFDFIKVRIYFSSKHNR